jgi:hypothetical protein
VWNPVATYVLACGLRNLKAVYVGGDLKSDDGRIVDPLGAEVRHGERSPGDLLGRERVPARPVGEVADCRRQLAERLRVGVPDDRHDQALLERDRDADVHACTCGATYDSRGWVLNPAPAASYTGPTAVATIVQNLAAKMGYAFENNGVTAQLNSPYFANTLAEQLRTVAQHAGIDVYIDGQTAPVSNFNAIAGTPGNNVIAICPRGQPRNVPVWELNPQSGLVGYPVRESQGYIRARTLFNPAYRFGGLVNLQNSGLANSPTGSPAFDVNTGKWLIASVSHTLESLKFGGQWFSDLLCYPPGSVAPVT